jgi:hypothetical protein
MQEVSTDVSMIDWVNRRVVLGGLLSIIPAYACRSFAQSTEYGGCWVGPSRGKASNYANSGVTDITGEALVYKSGVDGLELALVQTLDMLSGMFGVLPGFAYYREKDEPNAKATSFDLLKDRPDGTVLLGLKLLKDLRALPESPDAGVIAVCAHEFAHIVSYSNGYISQLTPTPHSSPFRAEQFADYMAGYFAGKRKLERPNFPAAVFATTTGMYGGSTHGNAEQRGNAVQEGFLCAYRRNLEPQKAIKRALEFALAEEVPDAPE